MLRSDFSFLENNIRKNLCFGMIGQTGIVLCGIGTGNQIAINAAGLSIIAHIMCFIFYYLLSQRFVIL